MKPQKFLLILFLIPLCFLFAQEPKQKITLDNQGNPKTEIVILSESSEEITIQFSINDFYFENLQTEKGLFSRLTFEDNKGTIELGKPQLPVFRKIIELPYDANPTVEIISSSIEELNIAEKGMAKIYPLQHPISKTPQHKPFEYDEALYKSDKPKSVIRELRINDKGPTHQFSRTPKPHKPLSSFHS